MIPAEKPPDSPNPRRSIAAAALASALIAGVAVVLGGLGGCSKPPPRSTEDPGVVGPKGDPWKAAAAKMRKDTDFATTTRLTSRRADVKDILRK